MPGNRRPERTGLTPVRSPTGFAAMVVRYDVAARYAVPDYHFHHGDRPAGPAAVLIASEL
jgi:hypothetical protein